MRWLLGLLAVVGLTACGNPCDADYVRKCHSTIATGFTPDGKVVYTPVTTCFCVEQVGA